MVQLPTSCVIMDNTTERRQLGRPPAQGPSSWVFTAMVMSWSSKVSIFLNISCGFGICLLDTVGHSWPNPGPDSLSFLSTRDGNADQWAQILSRWNTGKNWNIPDSFLLLSPEQRTFIPLCAFCTPIKNRAKGGCRQNSKWETFSFPDKQEQIPFATNKTDFFQRDWWECAAWEVLCVCPNLCQVGNPALLLTYRLTWVLLKARYVILRLYWNATQKR